MINVFQIRITSFGNPADGNFTAATTVRWHKADAGTGISATPEALSRTELSIHHAGTKPSNTG